MNAPLPNLDVPLEVRPVDDQQTDLSWLPDDELTEPCYSMRLRWGEADDGMYDFEWSECRSLDLNAKGRGWIERIFERLYWTDQKFRSWVQARTQRDRDERNS